MTAPTLVETRALTARDVMSCPAIVVSPDNTLWDASRLMMTSGVRHLVVSFHGRVVGTIDDRAVFAHWPMGPLVLRRTHLADVVRGRTSCVLAGVELQRVAELMMIDASDAVPVVDDVGAVLGIITASDLVAAVACHGISEGTR
ncbi:MAG TPA: CBS domain-containing protein [Mycobacteriales bacterium]|nr:CBS domain-containing protein [Mycobacteriales bacterium]